MRLIAQIDISKSTNFRGYMGLMTENNNPYARLRLSKQGDVCVLIRQRE